MFSYHHVMCNINISVSNYKPVADLELNNITLKRGQSDTTDNGFVPGM